MKPSPLTGKALKKKVITDIQNLPPMPQIMQKALDIIDDPSKGFKELSEVIEFDQSIALRILKMSNSAYYSRRRKISSIHEATMVLGLDALVEVITIASSSTFLGNALEGYGFPSGTLCIHSIAVALGSKFIAQLTSPSLVNEAFTAGLIHDAGKIILDRYILERKNLFDPLIAKQNHSLIDVEKKILGFNHAEITAVVCKKWDIPKSISTAVKYHHKPPRLIENRLATIVYTANQLVNWCGLDVDGVTLEAEPDILDKIGLTPPDIEKIMDKTIISAKNITENL